MTAGSLTDAEFEAVYTRFQPSLHRYLYRMTGNREDAADLAQEAFMRLYEQDIAPESPQAWLFQTGYRLCVDKWRRSRRIQWLSGDALSGISDGPAPEQLLLQQELKSGVEAMINSMPAPVRTIFALKYNEDYSYQHIARHIGRPENTVKCWMRRARIRLQQLSEREIACKRLG